MTMNEKAKGNAFPKKKVEEEKKEKNKAIRMAHKFTKVHRIALAYLRGQLSNVL